MKAAGRLRDPDLYRGGGGGAKVGALCANMLFLVAHFSQTAQ